MSPGPILLLLATSHTISPTSLAPRSVASTDPCTFQHQNLIHSIPLSVYSQYVHIHVLW